MSSSSFDDEYVLESCIGKGAFSSVYAVRHRRSHRQYAAKFLSRESDGYNPDEGRIATSLVHPNIIRTTAVAHRGDVEEILIMEMAEGGELFHSVHPRLPLPESEALSYVRQLLEAVSHIHGRGIVHRDIKLENLLLDAGVVKLIDFGFSKVIGATRTLKSGCGSPHYMAPEILLASRSAREGALKTRHAFYGKEVDMWAVGVILYVLTVGQYPFHHERRSQWQRQVLEGNVHFPADVMVSRPVMDLIAGLLLVDPDARLSAADALARCKSCADATESATATAVSALYQQHDTTPSKGQRPSTAAAMESSDIFFTPPTNRMLSADMSP